MKVGNIILIPASEMLPYPSDTERINMDLILDHIVLNVEDDEKMISFYTDVLMMPSERLNAYRAGKQPFPSVRINSDTIIDLFPKKLWHTGDATKTGVTNLNHFCIALSKHSWDELMTRLQENDVPIEVGPVSRWGARGDGTSIYFRDPEDNLIEARYYE